MAKITNNFVKGKMNKDLDERLIPNGEYRDAMNVQVSTSEGADVGTVQNILGNTRVENIIPDGGAFKYLENDSITDTTMLIEVFNEVVIIRDDSNNEYEVYMNNIIKPIDG